MIQTTNWYKNKEYDTINIRVSSEGDMIIAQTVLNF